MTLELQSEKWEEYTDLILNHGWTMQTPANLWEFAGNEDGIEGYINGLREWAEQNVVGEYKQQGSLFFFERESDAAHFAFVWR